jgi:phthiocerol/phenolphthiocerol synthesis type-I polyketide synthase A
MLSPVITRSFDQAEATSPTGQCHVFDAAADGFVRGEGCGAVILKRLSDALRDGDPVLAVVRGSAVNSDGRSNGLMAPNPAAQMAVLRAAYANSGVEPRDVDYVEAHANGTLLGDPIEARALGTVLGRARPAGAPLLIGSVKPSLGHLDAAAGIAGFIKAVLGVQRGHIPANLHFENPNPHIPFENLGLKVTDQPTDWPAMERPRRAGVSSFGFGGTNAHVVLEQRPDPGRVSRRPEPAVSTLVISGKTPARIASTAGMLADWMETDGAEVALADVAHTLNHHRARHAKFATVAALDRDQAVAGLRALATGRPADGVVGPHEGPCRPGTVFVYSGPGSQWAGMGRRLLADEPAFAAAVDELEPVFVSQAGFSLRQALESGDAPGDADRIQPVLLGMQLALTELWRCYGVRPDAVIGCSTGEVAAAVVAGALSPADGLRVIATCSRLMSRLSGQDAALHGTGMDPVLPELRTALADLAPQRPAIPVITATGGEPPVFDADHWATTLRNPVRFSEAVAAAGEDHGTFVEVSPHPLLTDAISDTVTEVHHHSIATLARDTHDTLTFHTNLNAAHTTQPPDTDHPAEPHPVLPATPWHHTHHWIGPPVVRSGDGTSAAGTQAGVADPAPPWITIRERVEAAVSSPRLGTLLGEHIGIPTTPPVHLWQAWLKPEAKPYPGFHRISGVDAVPVSVLLQTLSTAAAECGASALSDVRFEDLILVDQPRVIRVTADGETDGAAVTVSSASAADAPARGWTTHATARISHRQHDEPGDTFISGDEEMADYDVSSITELQRAWGTEGKTFDWSIDSCRSAPDALHADIDLPEASTVALLDAAVGVARLVDGSEPRLMLPATAESVRFDAGPPASRGAVEVRRRDGTGDELVVDIVVTAPDGVTCLDIRSLRYAAAEAGLAQDAAHDESAPPAWSQMPAAEVFSELETRMRAILAHELEMSASAVDVNRPFPELGLDSIMAMAVLREAKRLLGFELSATILWDHPTIASLASYLSELIVPPDTSGDDLDEDVVEATADPEGGVLDELFDHVESTPGS